MKRLLEQDLMNAIVNEELVSFKALEKKIYNYVCELAREITQHMLESYNKEGIIILAKIDVVNKETRKYNGILDLIYENAPSLNLK